jgi:hypothetical protein
MFSFVLDIRMNRNNWRKATSRWSHVRYKAMFSGCVKSGTSKFQSHNDEREKKPKKKTKKTRWLTHAGAILLRLTQLDLLQLPLLRALRTALAPRRALLFQFGVVPREPDVRDELVELGQRQNAAALLGYSVEEKSEKIGCRR